MTPRVSPSCRGVLVRGQRFERCSWASKTQVLPLDDPQVVTRGLEPPPLALWEPRHASCCHPMQARGVEPRCFRVMSPACNAVSLACGALVPNRTAEPRFGGAVLVPRARAMVSREGVEPSQAGFVNLPPDPPAETSKKTHPATFAMRSRQRSNPAASAEKAAR